MFKSLLLTAMLFMSVLANADNLILPENATPLEDTNLRYQVKTNNTLEDVFEQWSTKAWSKKNSVIWDVGEYVNIKKIRISSGIDIHGSFKEVVNELLKRINKMDFAKQNNLQIYSCLYSNNKLVIKTATVSDFQQGEHNEKCI